ncbi:hypothetical protein KW803_01460 [Candidatus Saccharibacteria bacterium]|nr:hypothetical protein [Candidatus Saccharibacteria bacterium]
MARYSPKVQEKIAKNLHEHKHGGKFVSRKQAIAAGINQGRSEGGRAPKKPA